MKPPNPGALRRRAARGTLEVEHVLAAAREPSLELAEMLETLGAEHDWRSAPCFPFVPMRTWSEVVVHYCRGGYGALATMVATSEWRPFVLALLEELGEEQAFEVVLTSTSGLSLDAVDDLDGAYKIAASINSLGMKGNGGAPEAQRRARVFLNRLLPLSRSDTERGVVLCALRYFGDRHSLDLVRATADLEPHWQVAKTAAIRAIKGRMRRQAQIA